MIELRMHCVLLSALLAMAAPPQLAAQQWTRLTSPDFEIYTDAGEKEGRSLLTRFEQVRSFFLKAAPVRPPEEFPVRIIAFRSREEFNRYKPNPIAAAYFTSNPYRDYIVLPDTSQEMFSLGVHEYTHLVVSHSGLRLPLWLNEGWADLFSSLRQVRDGVAVGDLLRSRLRLLENGEWLDLSTLTSVDDASPEYHESNRGGMFYSESWALAHMLYLSPDYKTHFAVFLNALNRGVQFDQACQAAYGKSSAAVYVDLRSYFKRKKLVGQVFEVSAGRETNTEHTPEIATVTDFDSRLILADLLAVIGQTDRAGREYEALDLQQPNRPEVALSLGYVALARNQSAAAREQFEKAFALGIRDARMCFQLASLQREAHQPLTKVIPVLERAVELRPDFSAALVTLGLARMQTREFEKANDTLMKAKTITPAAAPGVFTALTFANLQTGHLDDARNHAATARKYASTQTQLAALSAIENLLEARAKSQFPPQPGEKIQQVKGMVQAMVCAGTSARLRVLIDGQPMVFELPDPKAIEFLRPRGNTVQLTCGPQSPFPVVVGYVTPNIVRSLEY